MNCKGVIIPWTEYFFKGYSIELVKSILTDDVIISRMETIYSNTLSVHTISESQKFYDDIPYKLYNGHRYFFNSANSTANFMYYDFVYEALNSKERNSLKRAFDNDDSEAATQFDRHVRTVCNEWCKNKFSTQDHISLMNKIQNKIDSLNLIECEKINKLVANKGL